MQHSQEGKQLTEIILSVFKLNGLLVLSGDKLIKDLGLSSARWKVLGALEMADNALTVSDIAREMGQTRQAVQRLANEMIKDDLLMYKNNPKHKKAKLLYLTDKGCSVYEKAAQKQEAWVNSLANDMDAPSLDKTIGVMRTFIQKLECY